MGDVKYFILSVPCGLNGRREKQGDSLSGKKKKKGDKVPLFCPKEGVGKG